MAVSKSGREPVEEVRWKRLWRPHARYGREDSGECRARSQNLRTEPSRWRRNVSSHSSAPWSKRLTIDPGVMDPWTTRDRGCASRTARRMGFSDVHVSSRLPGPQVHDRSEHVGAYRPNPSKLATPFRIISESRGGAEESSRPFLPRGIPRETKKCPCRSRAGTCKGWNRPEKDFRRMLSSETTRSREYGNQRPTRMISCPGPQEVERLCFRCATLSSWKLRHVGEQPSAYRRPRARPRH